MKQQIKQLLATGLLIDSMRGRLEPFVSITDNSIPNSGSKTAPLSSINQTYMFETLVHITIHNTGDFTIQCIDGFVRFWQSEDYKLLCLAHSSKKSMMNKMANRKYNCGNLY